MRRTTVKDVALRAKVSAQTFSNVTNRRGKVSHETRQRVLEAMHDLQYKPTRTARSLRWSKTQQLGYHVLPGQLPARNPLIVDFVSALIVSAETRGYRITAFTGGRDTSQSLGELIDDRTVDGILLSDCDASDVRSRFLGEQQFPFAALGRTAVDLPQSWVDIDNKMATAAMVDHLVQCGHERIAFLGRDDDRYWTRDRRMGFTRGLERNGLTVDAQAITRADSRSTPRTIEALMRQVPPPTAIMADSDALAAAAINAVKVAGWRHPDDVAIAGFDGGLIDHLSEPPIASVHMPTSTIAEKLIERCLREIEGEDPAEPGELVRTAVIVQPPDG